MTLMQRRRALMAAKKESNILFDWDYTEGVGNKIINPEQGSSTYIDPVMQSDGLLLQGGSTTWSACAIAPNILPLSESYKAVITYSELSSDGTNTMVAFWFYNSTHKRMRIGRQKEHGRIKTVSTDATGANTTLPWNLADSGEITIQYNKDENTIIYTQGSDSYTQSIVEPSSIDINPRIASAQRGSYGINASVKIQHITIERA